MEIVYYKNDTAVVLQDARDVWATSGAGEDITTGTCAAQVYDTDRTTTVGASISMTNYTSRDGVAGNWWVGILEEDHAAVVDEGGNYTLKITLAASTDRVYEKWLDFTVRRR